MSWDDTSALLIQTVWMKQNYELDTQYSEESLVTQKRQQDILDWYIVETDNSILVKHRISPTQHYKEASIERFNLKFYGIQIPHVTTNHNDEKDIIKKGLNEYIQGE